MQSDRGIATRKVDRGADLVELVLESGVVVLGRRGDVCTEEAEVEPAEAAEGRESLATSANRVDRGAPVHADPEVPGLETPGMGADSKGDRHRRERVRLLREDPASVTRRLPPDVDACDRDALGEPIRRAGEDEPDHERRHGREHGDCADPLKEHTSLGARTTTSAEVGPGRVCGPLASEPF